MKIILLFKFKLCDKNQWWIWHKTATKYTYNDVQDILQRRLDPSFRKSIVAAKVDNGQRRAIIKTSLLTTTWEAAENSTPTTQQIWSRKGKQPVNSLKIHTFITLTSIFIYKKSAPCQTVICNIQLSHCTKRLQSIPQRLAPETSCNQAWRSAQPQRSDPWQNTIWEVCSENQRGTGQPNACGWHWSKERANSFQDNA